VEQAVLVVVVAAVAEFTLVALQQVVLAVAAVYLFTIKIQEK
jgi:hypothetical protein